LVSILAGIFAVYRDDFAEQGERHWTGVVGSG
jgi:hypothetical protein